MVADIVISKYEIILRLEKNDKKQQWNNKSFYFFIFIADVDKYINILCLKHTYYTLITYYYNIN